uniref:2-keto-3-deoxygluconate permease n=1 Tax=Tetragenococcus halophilus TaxID=51669 RepID=UPI0024E158E9|nr:2-keto-3-deoxygluconate permease [Tetragenococcus halophilus]
MKKIQKIPGGLILVPLLLGMFINTFFPSALEIGGTTTSLFKEGNNVLMGMFLIVCGTQINIKQVGIPLYKGTLLVLLKVAVGGGIAWLVSTIWGAQGVLGLTPFVLYCGLPSENSSLYVALASEYGDPNDVGAVALQSIKNGPIATMILMGAYGAANVPVMDVVSTIVPIVIGVILGNLDKDFLALAKNSQNLIIILMSFGIGASSNLTTLWSAGLSGVLLGVFSLALGVVFFFVYNLMLKKRLKTPLGAAIGSIANNAALTPAIIAASDTSLQPLVGEASAQLATACIITMLGVPILVKYCDNYMKKRNIITTGDIYKKNISEENNTVDDEGVATET